MSSKTPSPSALNRLPPSSARELLSACCYSQRHAARTLQHAPFRSFDHLADGSRAAWNALPQTAWVAAFHAYPRLGGVEQRQSAGLADRWARREQKVVREAPENVLVTVRRVEARYRKKHGFPFVVCCEGLTADELLNVLRERAKNDTDQEVFEAAAEHLRIVEGRLMKALVEARNMV